jgi:hypothetical protein
MLKFQLPENKAKEVSQPHTGVESIGDLCGVDQWI